MTIRSTDDPSAPARPTQNRIARAVRRIFGRLTGSTPSAPPAPVAAPPPPPPATAPQAAVTLTPAIPAPTTDSYRMPPPAPPTPSTPRAPARAGARKRKRARTTGTGTRQRLNWARALKNMNLESMTVEDVAHITGKTVAYTTTMLTEHRVLHLLKGQAKPASAPTPREPGTDEAQVTTSPPVPATDTPAPAVTPARAADPDIDWHGERHAVAAARRAWLAAHPDVSAKDASRALRLDQSVVYRIRRALRRAASPAAAQPKSPAPTAPEPAITGETRAKPIVYVSTTRLPPIVYVSTTSIPEERWKAMDWDRPVADIAKETGCDPLALYPLRRRLTGREAPRTELTRQRRAWLAAHPHASIEYAAIVLGITPQSVRYLRKRPVPVRDTVRATRREWLIAHPQATTHHACRVLKANNRDIEALRADIAREAEVRGRQPEHPAPRPRAAVRKPTSSTRAGGTRAR